MSNNALKEHMVIRDRDFTVLGLNWSQYAFYELVLVKSVARPGSKQATATKLGIYSIYSPRSSIHFLARCSNFCKPLKNIRKIVHPTRSPRQQWRGQIRRIGWVIKKMEAQVGQFLLGCKCPVSRGIVVQEQDPLGGLPAALAFFLQNVLQLH